MCEHRGDAVMSVKKSNRAAALFHRVLEGQYIIKNLVLISAGIVVGATVRGGGMRAEPR